MEIPDLVRQALGGEEIRSGVSLGDEDAACFTPTRTLVYRGEGLLSDEDVEEYSHDFERLAVSEGRRKTKFTLSYVDGTESLAVPGDRTEPILERLLEGNLRASDVLEPDESVAGVYRFSELTLVVADRRLVKHIGEYTWDEDFEVFPYADVTGLSFEEGSVATSVVVEVDGRPDRIKAPNEQAPRVRQTLQQAVFDYHGVASLEELNRAVAVAEEADAEGGESGGRDGGGTGGLGLDSDIDPLVGDDGGDDGPTAAAGSGDGGAGASAGDRTTGGGDRSAGDGSTGDGDGKTGGDESAAGGTEAGADGVERAQTVVEPGSEPDETVGVPAGSDGTTDEDLKAVSEQLTVLTEAVERQNALLEQQQQTVRQLIEELRRGR